MENLTLQYITAIAAGIGAVLGIMNTWRATSQNRIKFTVRPTHVISVPDGTQGFSIEVVNLSNFPITVSEIGFTGASNSIKRSGRFAVTNSFTIARQTLPVRLESREAESFYFDPMDANLMGKAIGKAYARTSCGEVAYGITPALKQLRQSLMG